MGEIMENSVDLSVVISIIERKIASLNLDISKNRTPELEQELEKYLNIKKEIYEGNTSIIKKIIDGEEM